MIFYVSVSYQKMEKSAVKKIQSYFTIFSFNEKFKLGTFNQ
jgi:hypothetical protein